VVLESPGCAGFVAAQGNSRSPGAERNDPWGGYAMATCSVPDLFSRPRGPRSVSEEAEGKSSRKREREKKIGRFIGETACNPQSQIPGACSILGSKWRGGCVPACWKPAASRHPSNFVPEGCSETPNLVQPSTAFVATRPLVQGAKLLPSPPI